jgi:hypothetical protein
MTTVLRRIFPREHECPKDGCGCLEYTPNGTSRGNDLQYRTCAKCGYKYVVSAIAKEVRDEGAACSRIIPA